MGGAKVEDRKTCQVLRAQEACTPPSQTQMEGVHVPGGESGSQLAPSTHTYSAIPTLEGGYHCGFVGLGPEAPLLAHRSCLCFPSVGNA